MTIEFFIQDDEQPSLDFLPEVLEENPKINGQFFDVFSFKKAKSGKGYLVYTSHFICWFFKKEKVLTQALEALDYYCKIGSGYQFVVQVDKKVKSKFRLGIDTERTVKFVPLENTSFVLETYKNTAGIALETKTVNPFLITNPLPSLPPLNTTDLANSGEQTTLITHQGRKGGERPK